MQRCSREPALRRQVLRAPFRGLLSHCSPSQFEQADPNAITGTSPRGASPMRKTFGVGFDGPNGRSGFGGSKRLQKHTYIYIYIYGCLCSDPDSSDTGRASANDSGSGNERSGGVNDSDSSEAAAVPTTATAAASATAIAPAVWKRQLTMTATVPAAAIAPTALQATTYIGRSTCMPLRPRSSTGSP